ncbi:MULTISPECIES: hypothetical protein [unclassified Streptomyces]|uniref:hypothetical protein n=1 Tax=unclassified Streptomyces TaxID=2593676 RepID=UPI0022594A3C|nr:MULTISPECIES: hypothetical protein [unclassified Streptomyces]MCX5051255.1 hypothetical protein [Streptomyces sp. NBC_00474]MCX5249140.1 hypothetical protein [Streptomyces sp. NBC_00201]
MRPFCGEVWAVDVIAIGNAFHRLPRSRVAARAYRWLRPGGRPALVWSQSPRRGELPWQRDMADVVARWMDRVGGHDRVPADAGQARRLVPDREVLEGAGLEVVGTFGLPAPHTWTPRALVGNVFSTSVLSREALGRRVEDFEADLRGSPRGHDSLTETIDTAYELGRAPGQRRTGSCRPVGRGSHPRSERCDLSAVSDSRKSE